VACRFEVTAGMLMLGGVTAKHFAAGLTDSQVNPATVDLQTVFAAKQRKVRFGNQLFWIEFSEVGQDIGRSKKGFWPIVNCLDVAISTNDAFVIFGQRCVNGLRRWGWF
jgi:hypothetical protein